MEFGFHRRNNNNKKSVIYRVSNYYCRYKTQIFSKSTPLGQFSHRVAMSACVSVCAMGCSFFQGLSSALRLHDQFKASHWSSLPPSTCPQHPRLQKLFIPLEKKRKTNIWKNFMSMVVSSALVESFSVSRMLISTFFFFYSTLI